MVASHVAAVELAGLAKILGHIVEDDCVILADHLELEIAPLCADLGCAKAIIHQELTSACSISNGVTGDM